jgi:hypothetical protein
VITVAGNGIGLLVPQVIAHAIDAFTAGKLELHSALIEIRLTVPFPPRRRVRSEASGKLVSESQPMAGC